MANKKLVEAVLSKVDALKPVAKDLDCTLAQLALAWCAKNPNVSTVITGASKVSQVRTETTGSRSLASSSHLGVAVPGLGRPL